MKIHSLQAIRAVAAWLVVADHALLEVTQNRAGDPLSHVAWLLGSTGVDVFFVISGFIMVHICWGSFGRSGATTDFLRRRIIRIVPLYWLATCAAFAYHKVSATHGAHAGSSELLHSLAFVPYYSSDERSWSPVLPQGWTLNYEIMFYVFFAVSLLLPRRLGIPAVGLTLGAFLLLGPLSANDTVTYLASPIVLWFVLGMGLATVWRQWGFAEPAWLARPSRFLEPLGDASYSTYLAHGLFLTALLRLWTSAIGPPSIWIVPASLVVATVAGLAIHLTVEKPVLQLINHLWKRRVERSSPRLAERAG